MRNPKPKYKKGDRVYYIIKGYSDSVGIFKILNIDINKDNNIFYSGIDRKRDKSFQNRLEYETNIFPSKLLCLRRILQDLIDTKTNDLKYEITHLLAKAESIK